MEGYIPSFSFLAPKLRVLASMGAIFTPKPLVTGGDEGGGGGGEIFFKTISEWKVTCQISAS